MRRRPRREIARLRRARAVAEHAGCDPVARPTCRCGTGPAVADERRRLAAPIRSPGRPATALDVDVARRRRRRARCRRGAGASGAAHPRDEPVDRPRRVGAMPSAGGVEGCRRRSRARRTARAIRIAPTATSRGDAQRPREASLDHALVQPQRRGPSSRRCRSLWVATRAALPSPRTRREEFGEDDVGGGLVEIAGRLVGEHQRGPVGERAGDGDALLLAAGELGSAGGSSRSAEAERAEQRSRRARAASARGRRRGSAAAG